MKKVVIVVADGRVQSIFSDEEIDVDVVDFDSCLDSNEDQEKLGDYIDECRKTMKETIC